MDFGGTKIVDGRVLVTFAASTVWMTKHQIADLFECFVSKVGSNILAILKAGVLDESAVCRRHPYEDGSFVELYNLEMIAALAFRIRTHNSDLFRQWLMRQVLLSADRQKYIVISCLGKTLPN